MVFGSFSNVVLLLFYECLDIKVILILTIDLGFLLLKDLANRKITENPDLIMSILEVVKLLWLKIAKLIQVGLPKNRGRYCWMVHSQMLLNGLYFWTRSKFMFAIIVC